MVNCFGPLGGVCAFLGFLDFLVMAAGGLLWFSSWLNDDKPGIVKSAKLGGTGAVLLAVVVILAIINNAMLPMACK